MKNLLSAYSLLLLMGLMGLKTVAHAQHRSSDETTVGLLVESTFSGFRHPGLTPSLTIGCATYQFQIGPRITFEQIAGSENQNEKNTYWDFGYRYGFLLQSGFTLYAAMRAEYGSHRSTNDWYYNYPVSDGLYLGDNSFNARTEESHYNFNFYLGLGAEFIVVNKLYLNVFAGAGIKTLSGYTDYSNLDTDELALHSSWIFDNNGFSWLSSAGIGYRL
ncbi:MAG: hypothetical protein HYZ14_13745 [Bacteroidetes bacterium]|nr:hypothetical protein [Bacteroidota bacterium]